MRVFLDTNVLVGAFATRGLSADVMRVVLAEHELLTAEVVISEMQNMLTEHMGIADSTVSQVVQLIRRYHVEAGPGHEAPASDHMHDDAWVLAAALSAGADVLVTGDADLLDLSGKLERLRVITPRQFWSLLRKQEPS